MKKMKGWQVMIGVVFVLLMGCLRSYEDYYPKPEGKVVVEGDKIYLNNELYAELRYRTSIFDMPGDHLAFSIYYYPYDKEEWIYPSCGQAYYVVDEKKMYSTLTAMKGFKKTAKERGYTIGDSDRLDDDKVIFMIGKHKYEGGAEGPCPLVSDIRITEDGRYVCYNIKRYILLMRRHESITPEIYRVKYGRECFEPTSETPTKKGKTSKRVSSRL